MPEGVFQDEALDAVQKSFKPVSVKDTRVKQQAIALLDELNLERLRAEVKKVTKSHLEVSFRLRRITIYGPTKKLQEKMVTYK